MPIISTTCGAEDTHVPSQQTRCVDAGAKNQGKDVDAFGGKALYGPMATNMVERHRAHKRARHTGHIVG